MHVHMKDGGRFVSRNIAEQMAGHVWSVCIILGRP